MPFLRAGFNGTNFRTGIRGWTRPLEGRRAFASAELRQFECGDFFWYGKRFLAWGEQCVLGSWPIELDYEHQHGLAHSDIETKRAYPARSW